MHRKHYYSLLGTLYLLCFFSQSLRAQAKLQLEPNCGVQHVRHVGCTLENKSEHRALSVVQGLRLNWRLNPRLTLIGGTSTTDLFSARYLFPPKWYAFVTTRLYFHPKRQPRISGLKMFNEVGLEYEILRGGVSVPYYFGVTYAPQKTWGLVGRLRAPSFPLLADRHGNFKLTEFRLEVGVVMDLSRKARPPRKLWECSRRR